MLQGSVHFVSLLINCTLQLWVIYVFSALSCFHFWCFYFITVAGNVTQRDLWFPHLTIFACWPLRVMPVLYRQPHLLWEHSYTVTCVQVMVFDSTTLLPSSFFFSILWTMERVIQICWLGQSIPWSLIFHTFTSYKFVLSIYY